MKFVKEVTGEKMAIPAAALKLCGFENGDKAELHALPSAAIILKQKMTAMEVIQAMATGWQGGIWRSYRRRPRWSAASSPLI